VSVGEPADGLAAHGRRRHPIRPHASPPGRELPLHPPALAAIVRLPLAGDAARPRAVRMSRRRTEGRLRRQRNLSSFLLGQRNPRCDHRDALNEVECRCSVCGRVTWRGRLGAAQRGS
jgi:hypothetical protein